MQIEILQRQINMLTGELMQARMNKDLKKVAELNVRITELDRELMQTKFNENFERAKNDGAFDRASKMVMLVHTMIAEINNMLDEVYDIFNEYEMPKDKVMAEQRKFMRAAKEYFEYYKHIPEQSGQTLSMFEDIDYLDTFLRVWADLKEPPKPDSLMHGCTKAAKQSLAKARMCKGCKMAYSPNTLICNACAAAYKKGFEKGARWLENKRVERIMNKNNEQAKETKETRILEEKN